LNHGVPLVTGAKGGALAQGISQLAALLWPLPVAERKSVLGRLFASRPNSPPQLKPGH
jgi:pilus assembly protein CpaE